MHSIVPIRTTLLLETGIEKNEGKSERKEMAG